MIDMELTAVVDNVCDYTFNFYWYEKKLNPVDIIPNQNGTVYTYQQFVDELKKGEDVYIRGNVGKYFAYCLGTNITYFGGNGQIEEAGNIFVDGDIGQEAGMAMVAGSIYVTGNIQEPMGNIIEVESNCEGYRKFISVTELMCGQCQENILKNHINFTDNTLILNDGILRGTLASRCNCDGKIIVEGDVFNGTGLLMEQGTIIVKGDAGLNAGAHLNGGNVIIKGVVGEFAGTYMNKGSLIINDAKGYIGAGMTGGTIYSKRAVNTSPPADKVRLTGKDIPIIRKFTGVGRVEAMLYRKYEVGEQKDRYVKVKMRDGSIVMRKME